MTTRYAYLDSPLGPLFVSRDDLGLTALYLPTGRHHTQQPPPGAVPDDAVFTDVRTQLEEYFAGERQEFDLALNAAGTPFQQRVWRALLEIPYGRTASYGSTALAIGVPTAARAVGLANGRNPISIVVPCHRVVGANGSLTGYGGGLPAKKWLLAHEAAHDAARVAGHDGSQLSLFADAG